MSKNTQNPYFPSAILTADRQEFDSSLMTIIEGEIPENLPGHLFILAAAGSANSPSVPNTEMILPAGDGTSLISGDGMIFRLDFHKEGQTFQPGKVSLKTKLVNTPSFWADKAINEKPEYAQLKFYNLGLARISEWVGVRNVSNTSWLPMKFKDENARLLVTLDAGRSHEIDTESLDVVTPLGWNKEYAKQMELKLPFPLLMSSAHPYFDPRTNEVFTTNYSKSLIRMLLPSLQYDLEKIEESIILQILEDFLKDLERLLNAIVNLIKKLIEWENKLPCFKKFFRIAISSVVIGDIKSIIKQFRVAPSIPKIKEIEKGLYQLLIDEIHDTKNLTDLKEELEDLIQLIRLALQVLMGSKDLENITYLVRWDGKGDLERWQLVNDDDTPVIIDQTMHQFGVTKDYVVLMDTSLKIGIAQLISLKNPKITNFLRNILDYPQSPDSKIYLVPRNQLSEGQKPAHCDFSQPIANQPPECLKKVIKVQKVTLPMEVFHFHTNYANPNHEITLHTAHACAWDVAEWLRKEDLPLTDNPNPPTGMLVDGMDIGRMGRYVIDATNGNLKDTQIFQDWDYTWAVALYAYSDIKQGDDWLPPEQFENIYWNAYGASEDLLADFVFKMYKDYKYREVDPDLVKQVAAEGKPSNLFRLDVQQMKICDSYQFPPGYYGNSPQFIPSANSTGESTDGYITCSVNYNTEADNSLLSGQGEIWIFDAKNLKSGPRCRLSHPQLKFAFTTHTTWLPKIAPRQPGLYCIPVEQDFEDMVKQAAVEFPKVQALIEQLFREEVYPHFPKC